MERQVRASLPALDPNGEPLSIVLRGAAASLGELRCTLATPDARRQLQLEVQAAAAARGGGDQFDDVNAEDTAVGAAICNGGAAITQPQAQSTTSADARDMDSEGKKKRGRADGEDGDEVEDPRGVDEIDQEQLILFMPSVQCTCSSWNVKDATGDVLVTTLRVLFIAESEENDVAVDGCGIALHAVDSLPGECEEDISHHVYCQIAEPMSNEGGLRMGMGCASAMGMAAQIAEENDAEPNGDADEPEVEGEDSSEEDGTMEVYFKPSSSSEGESQSDQCQTIFDALTTLASLNPVDDSDGGGGLFSMLSMMAGIDASNSLGGGMMIAGQEDDGDDEMVIRLGGSNNLVEIVENDDGSSDGAPAEERQAMLQRLDDLLVVPPEYEIASEDGRFDDADDDDDGIL
ncbi:hypothetical protein ACHAXT_000524 [Thalassiosira profunda]